MGVGDCGGLDQLEREIALELDSLFLDTQAGRLKFCREPDALQPRTYAAYS